MKAKKSPNVATLGVLLYLAMGAQVEEGHSTGTGVGADDRAHMVDMDILRAVLFLQFFSAQTY